MAKTTIAEREALRAIDHVWGPKAARTAKRINRLASHQGGSSVRENYELLGKRTAGIALAVAAGVAVGAVAGAFALKRVIASHAAKRQQAAALAPDDAEGDCLRAAAALDQGRSLGDQLYIRYGKRLWDVVLGTLALPVVGVVCAVCGTAVHLEDGGPVFYNAPRVGKDGREFTMYKLRSMKVNAPDLVMEDGSTYNGADDPRMTRVGAFMRKTSLDEMPQFLNVLKGDMSIVGPRPDLQREVELYEGEEPLKLAVRPGITGYAAVYGRNALPWHERLALDVEYVKNLSFPLDAKVFFKTFQTVFNQEGIYVEEDESAERPEADRGQQHAASAD